MFGGRRAAVGTDGGDKFDAGAYRGAPPSDAPDGIIHRAVCAGMTTLTRRPADDATVGFGGLVKLGDVWRDGGMHIAGNQTAQLRY